MTRPFAVLFAVFAAAIAVVGYVGARTSERAPVLAQSPGYWQGRVQGVGGEAAYRELAAMVTDSSLSDQHLFAHLFGQGLFQAQGLAGVSVCDARFAYGCWHEFTARAILEMGTAVAKKLVESCGDNASCEHGVGHGLLAYEGYTFEGLRSALRICNALSSKDPSAGCRGGIFMEYRIRSMLGEGPQPLDESVPLGECDKVEDIDKPACVFALPGWWQSAGWQTKASTTAEDTVRKMARWCVMSGTTELERTCVGGIGVAAVDYASRRANETVELCMAASPEPSLQLACRTYAANIIGMTESAEAGASVCAGYYGDAAAYCLSQGGERFKIVIPAPATPTL